MKWRHADRDNWQKLCNHNNNNNIESSKYDIILHYVWVNSSNRRVRCIYIYSGCSHQANCVAIWPGPSLPAIRSSCLRSQGSSSRRRWLMRLIFIKIGCGKVVVVAAVLINHCPLRNLIIHGRIKGKFCIKTAKHASFPSNKRVLTLYYLSFVVQS